MEQLIEMTSDVMKQVYTNEKLRNAVAYAHGCYSAHPNCEFKYFKALMYPISYKVTSEQIKEAEKELDRAKKEAIKNLANKLVFVGMGMTYEGKYKDDVCNHRIRTTFLNKNGVSCFVEFGTGRGESTRVDHSIFHYDKEDNKGRVNNYNNLERAESLPKYTLQNILNLVNKKFDCCFTEIEVDNYTLNCNDFICQSPKTF